MQIDWSIEIKQKNTHNKAKVNYKLTHVGNIVQIKKIVKENKPSFKHFVTAFIHVMTIQSTEDKPMIRNEAVINQVILKHHGTC